MLTVNLIVQYYEVRFSKDIEYKQNEVNYVLKTNCNNKHIDHIYLLIEEDYKLDFLSSEEKNKINKVIIGKRLSYYDAFDFYNKNLSNSITILANADIYFDDSLHILKHLNWNIKQIVAPTRYEHSMESNDNLLYGTFQDLNKGSPWVDAYDESVFTQDAWIWCTDKVNIPFDDCNFNLGTVGCDNYIATMFCKYDFTIISSSKYICCNHYDHLSNDHSNVKGGESFVREKRVGTFPEYTFVSSGSTLIDKHTLTAYNYNKNISGLGSQIKYVKIDNKTLPLSEKLLDFQYTASSYNIYKPSMAKINSKMYWEPTFNDDKKEIIIKYNHLMEIPYIDIQGLPYELNNNNNKNKNCYVTKLEIYSGINGFSFGKVCEMNGINVSNYGYVKRLYFDKPIVCSGIKIKILEYHIKPVLRFEIYYFDHTNLQNVDKKSETFRNFVFNCNYLDKNRHILEFKNLFEETLIKSYNTNLFSHHVPINYDSNNEYYNEFFSCNNIDKFDFWNKFKGYLFDDKFNITHNLLNEPIKPGICLFTYIMNRRQNLEKYFKSWLNKSVDQIIILDWSSKEDNYDIIKNINDSRVIYVKVVGEPSFIRTYAQNLAAKFCKYDKILKIDSDISITDNFFEKNVLNPGEFIVGNFMCARDDNEKYTHGNVYLYLNDYFRIGGYNELIKTYGNDDSDFSLRLQLLGGLTEKIFDLDTMYHNPHTNEARKKNMNGVYNTYVEIFKHRYYMDKVPFWNRYFKHNEFNIEQKNNNFYECTRITDDIYKFSPFIKDCEINAINTVYEWFRDLPKWKHTDDIEYKKLFLSEI